MPVVSLEGIAPELPPEGDYWIAPSAYLIGRVSLGRGCSVWFGSVLRGDIGLLEIGEDTNIQENCIFHTDFGVPFKVGNGCTIGHRALLHGCRLGNNCLVGIGATLLNNTVIGDNCLIGAHTLLPEGKTIPAGSLVLGSPGRVVRPLSEGEIEGLRQTAKHYIENMRRFQPLF